MRRAQGNFQAVPALAWNDALTQASLVHSDDMVALHFFSHSGSNSTSAGQRAMAAGYGWWTSGENVAVGLPAVDSMMATWLTRPGDYANLMNACFAAHRGMHQAQNAFSPARSRASRFSSSGIFVKARASRLARAPAPARPTR